MVPLCRYLLPLLLFCSVRSTAFAQSTITINGAVTDPRGNPIPGVSVHLISAIDEELASSVTNDEGKYSFKLDSLLPGKYLIRAFVGGFDPAQREFQVGETIATGTQIVTVDLMLRRPPTMGDGHEKNYATVKVFYATDRESGGQTTPANFYTGRRNNDGHLELGICEVSIPRNHRPGLLETPSIYKLEFREDPEKHVVLLNVTPEKHDAFFRDLSSRVANSAGKEALVFVHGYNVSFEDAARRTAQLSYDLRPFDGAPILYSWPSEGNLAGYMTDEATIDWAVPHLKGFLEEVATLSGAKTVHLIAHSMGNRALTNALNAIATEERSTPRPHFRQVLLAAPDIDVGVFKQLVKNFRNTADRITVYASTKDLALEASKRFHTYTRAGESASEIAGLEGIEPIDVSAVDKGPFLEALLGHTYFADNQDMLLDIARILMGKATRERPKLQLRQIGNASYWEVVR